MDLRIYPMPFNTVLFIYGERDGIQIDPDYQRFGDIWSLDKRQLLIDSLLNEYDLPKLYFHEFTSPKELDGQTYQYAIIDGRQRLESIWAFIEGRFALSEDFTYIHDESVKAAGMTYHDLARDYPKLKSRFDATQLPIILIQTDDTELIEEMFSRLNEAVPLTAPEKRNALGGPLPPAIRRLATTHPLFTDRLPYTNRRYRHFDLAAKFLFFEFVDGVMDTKKIYLDYFVEDFRDNKFDEEALGLEEDVTVILDAMAATFVSSDRLLSSVGMNMTYYLLFKVATEANWVGAMSRQVFQDFEAMRRANRYAAERDIRTANYDLLEFDRLTQSPNDSVAITFRLAVMHEHIRELLGLQPEPLPAKFDTLMRG